MDRYYEERGGHYYREVRDEREIGLSGGNNGSTSMGRHSQEPETDRGNKKKKHPPSSFFTNFVFCLDVKRRKMDGSSLKVSIGVT